MKKSLAGCIHLMSDKQLPDNTAPEASYVESWRRLWWLPCELSLGIPLQHFTVGELLRLQPGSIVASTWSRTREISIYAKGQRIGWAELEALNEHIAARITELV